MSNRLANPSSLGFAGFAITLWMVSMVNAGWFPATAPQNMDLMLAFTFGGTAMALAGLMEYFRGRTLDMFLFLAFGAFWWAWALHARSAGTEAMPSTGGGYEGWFFLLWAVVAFYMWVASFRDGTARVLFSLGLWLSFLALAIADWVSAPAFTVLGGYLGLITAIVGGYISAADVINTSFQRVVLPTGEHPLPEYTDGAAVAHPTHV